jgi:acetyl-CoA carboxylase carboxyltransferase component
MATEAAVNAVYARRIADIDDPGERQAFVTARRMEYEADVNLLRMASDLVVDSVVTPQGLRDDLLGRLAAADEWQRAIPGRHHPVSPV